MAYAIQMIQPTTRRRTIGYTGVSWTCLFFGPLPALYRGHIFGFIGMTLINLATFGLSALVFIFVYNAWHYHSLLARGFSPAGHKYGNVSHNVVRMAGGNNDNLDDIFDSDVPDAYPRGVSMASPELSERLIDDYRPGPFSKK
ncbi:MAG: hypothetical protein COB93_10190 [Sneathiella sp.]|nr:MAG: hypothetical protein COB93_10190 [Sneathiella sp.]